MIFASSNWVMTGYRFEQPNKLTTDLPPKPMNAYGVSKLLGERLGAITAGEMSFIAFRIGACESNFNNLSHCDPWFQQMWLSDRDLCHAMERGLVAENIEYAVLNLMSNNWQMRWDIEETRKKIGYDPVDGAAIIETKASLLRRQEAIEHHSQWKRYSDLCARVMV
jgi:NAD+ dependent glucose-6-phosphate dehydrogenase